MTIYIIRFYNDMGHLMTNPEYSKIPNHIYKFVHIKASMYLDNATDKSGLSCRFYILKPGFKKYWTYYYYNDTINIIFDVDLFDTNRMMILNKKN